MDTQSQDSTETSTLFFCRICQSVYRQAKLLPCLHSFCRPCLVTAVSHNRTTSDGAGRTVITCPVCSHSSPVPASGVTALPDNAFLNRICQEYIQEVQSNLVARRVKGHEEEVKPRTVSEFAALRSRLSEELARPKYTPSPHTTPPHSTSSDGSSRPSSTTSTPLDDLQDTDQRSPRTRPSSVSSTGGEHDVFGDGMGYRLERGRSSGGNTASALEAIRNMNRLQSKIMSLQGEALRVTYSIEQVNQSLQEWHDHKEELKKAVERRSSQFQFYIKRLERHLINQIEAKATEDQLYTESDRAKTDLRTNLRNILHEVSVLKSVQELGKDAEINQLAGFLLGESAGMHEVELTKLHYDMDVPVKSIEEIIEAGFGKLSLKEETCNVFTPEITSFADVAVGNATTREDLLKERLETEDLVAARVIQTEKEQVPKAEDETTTVQESRRRTRTSRRHKTDLGLQSEDVRNYLQQFQDARESLKDRRREILRQGQMARQDQSPMRSDLIMADLTQRMRSSSRSGRGQSSERQGMHPMASRPAHQFRRASVDDGTADGASNPPAEPPIKFQFGAGASHQVLHSIKGEELNVPSPVIEEASYPSSPVRGQNLSPLAGATPRSVKDGISSPEEASGSETILAQPESSKVPSEERQESVTSPSSSTTSSPPPEYVSLDIRGRARSSLSREGSSRPMRRAISSAADKRSKMEFLRETWQRRKELLIQNEGFVSSDSTNITAPSVPTQLTADSKPEEISNDGSSFGGQVATLPASTSTVQSDRMQEIQNRLSSIRQEIIQSHDNQSYSQFSSHAADEKTLPISGEVTNVNQSQQLSTVTESASSSSKATTETAATPESDNDSEPETVYTDVIQIPVDLKYTASTPTTLEKSTPTTQVISTTASKSSSLGQESTQSPNLSIAQPLVSDTAMSTISTTAASAPLSQTGSVTEPQTEARPYRSVRETYLSRLQRRYTAPVQASDIPTNLGSTPTSSTTPGGTDNVTLASTATTTAAPITSMTGKGSNNIGTGLPDSQTSTSSNMLSKSAVSTQVASTSNVPSAISTSSNITPSLTTGISSNVLASSTARPISSNLSQSSTTTANTTSNAGSPITAGSTTTASTTATTATSVSNRYGSSSFRETSSTKTKTNSILESSADELLEQFRSAARSRIQNRYGMYEPPRETAVQPKVEVSTVPAPATTVQTQTIPTAVHSTTSSGLQSSSTLSSATQRSAFSTITKPTSATTSSSPATALQQSASSSVTTTGTDRGGLESTHITVSPLSSDRRGISSLMSTSRVQGPEISPQTATTPLTTGTSSSSLGISHPIPSGLGSTSTLPQSLTQGVQPTPGPTIAHIKSNITEALTPIRSKPPALRLGSKHSSIQDDEMSPSARTASPTSPIAAAVAAATGRLGSPGSPTGNEALSNGRLREIARKKRERWRHLTIT